MIIELEKTWAEAAESSNSLSKSSLWHYAKSKSMQPLVVHMQLHSLTLSVSFFLKLSSSPNLPVCSLSLLLFFFFLLASLHWTFSDVVKSHWELITFVILCMLIKGRALRLKQQTQASGKLGISPAPSAVGGGREDWTSSKISRQFMLMFLCFFCVITHSQKITKLTHRGSGAEAVALNKVNVNLQSQEAGLLAL